MNNIVEDIVNPLISFDRKFESWDQINKSIILSIFSELEITKKEKTSLELFDEWKLSKDEEEFTFMIIIATKKDGSEINYTVYDETREGWSSMARTTGLTACAFSKLIIENNKLQLLANSASKGSAIEELDVQFAHDKLEIGFNSRYLLDVASQLDGDKIEIFLNDTGSPALIKDPSDFDSIFVVMPMKG